MINFFRFRFNCNRQCLSPLCNWVSTVERWWQRNREMCLIYRYKERERVSHRTCAFHKWVMYANGVNWQSHNNFIIWHHITKTLSSDRCCQHEILSAPLMLVHFWIVLKANSLYIFCRSFILNRTTDFLRSSSGIWKSRLQQYLDTKWWDHSQKLRGNTVLVDNRKNNALFGAQMSPGAVEFETIYSKCQHRQLTTTRFNIAIAFKSTKTLITKTNRCSHLNI